MAQPQHVESQTDATADAAATGARLSAGAALSAGDATYDPRPSRSRIGRPYRRLKRRIRHTPTKEFIGSAIVLAVAIAGLIVVLAIALR